MEGCTVEILNSEPLLIQQEIEAFLTSFHALTGAHMGIHDLEYDIAISSGQINHNLCAFCKHRSQRFIDRCVCEDRYYLAQAVDSQQITVFQCHLGVTSVIIPIVENGITVGVVDFGMILILPDPQIDFPRLFDRLCGEYPEAFQETDRNKMLEAYNHTAVMTVDSLNHYITLASCAARGLHLQHLFTTQQLSSESRLRNFVNFWNVERRPLSSISIADAAKQLNFSCSHLNRLSRAVFGMPLKQYVLKRKIEAAAELLRTEKHMTLSELAASVGIDDPRYFSRLFCKHMGCKCSEYRKKFFL